MKIESIQFGGGSYYTTLFLGSLHQLIEDGTVDLDEIKTLGGGSAGSVIALLINVGYTPKEIFQELISVDLEEIFLNDVNILNLFNSNGFCYGKKFIEKVIEIVQKKIPEFEIKSTFEFLKKETGKLLVITGTNLTKKRVDLFCFEETPSMSIMYAIRLSISIPLLFQTLEYKSDLIIDGAWFKDIRDLKQNYFKKESSLHFVIKIPTGQKGSLIDITSHIRAFFIESYWVVNLEQFPYVIEIVAESTSYERGDLLFLFQKGVVTSKKWIKTKLENEK